MAEFLPYERADNMLYLKKLYMSVLVKNAPYTSDLQPPRPYCTWVEYWESMSGIKIVEGKRYNCPAGDCNEVCFRSEFDGCHVQKAFDATQRMYIIPLCSGCNHRNDYFFVDEGLLVPAP